MTSTSASEAEMAGRRGEVADPVPLRLDLAPRSGQCGNNNPGMAAARRHDGDGELAAVGRFPHCRWARSPFLELLSFFAGIRLRRQPVNGDSSGHRHDVVQSRVLLWPKLVRRLAGGGTEEAWASFQGWRQGVAACVKVGWWRGAGAVGWRPRAAIAGAVVSELMGNKLQSKVVGAPGESLAWWFIGPATATPLASQPPLGRC
uniref:Uncharacterized protein n=1 Tax=Oryza barthii TaxID=65489 RepID=A0A0D3F410_9ORYZ